MKMCFYFAAAAFALLLAGCNNDHDEKSEKPEKAKPAKVMKAPNVAGKWTGTWESTKQKGHGGGLSCEATEKSKNEWEAVFTAEYGKTSKYNVNLKGKPEDGKVVFGGKVDLGEKSGGVFIWTGRASEKEFTGEYEGGGDTGSFKMTRKSDKSGRASPVRTDDHDAQLSDKATRPFVE